MKKLNLKYIEEKISKDNYKLISNKYINAHSPLRLECPNGHKLELSWQKWTQGRRCKYCAGSRLYFENIMKSFEAENYILLTKKKDYKNTKQKLEFVCPAGHTHSISYNHWKKGNRCKICYVENLKKPFSDVKKEIENENYVLLSNQDDYENSYSKFLCRCPSGHKIKISWNLWKSGVRCKTCSFKKRNNNFKLSYELIKNSFEIEGYKLLSKNYINAFNKLNYICPSGHKGSIRWNDFQQGCRCSKCSNTISKPENEINQFLTAFDLKIENNVRDIIAPYELDLVVLEEKVAIEYCGLYWHSEVMGKNENYHLNKLEKSEEKGYKLITIFEDEWRFKKDIVLNRLKHILNISDAKTIYARKCNIIELSVKEKNEFLDKYHLQGKDSSVIKLGLIYNNRLMSVMTFSHGNIAKGTKPKNDIWELNRFCSDYNFNVVGAASKLLKYFISNYDWKEIFSYADRRWSSGDLYNKLNFRFEGPTKVGYWYTDGVRRIHRFNLRKNNTNSQKLDRYYKIWDCGNLKYRMINGGNNG